MSTGYRIERDSLGEVHVPEDALYGAQTQRAKENFPISGQRFHRRFIQALGWIKQAAAETNEELGTISSTVASAIVSAAGEVASGDHDAQFILDIYQTGSGTSTNMNTNEVISHLATELLATISQCFARLAFQGFGDHIFRAVGANGGRDLALDGRPIGPQRFDLGEVRRSAAELGFVGRPHGMEQAAAMASVSYARTTDGLGACMVTTGPGVTNTITGLVGAWQETQRAPSDPAGWWWCSSAANTSERWQRAHVASPSACSPPEWGS